MTVALFRRFPRLRFRPAESELVPASQRNRFPTLAADLAVADEVVLRTFVTHDVWALQQQNVYRRQQVALIFGGALTTVFSAVEAGLTSQRWPPAVVAVLGLLTAAVAATARERGALQGYLADRVKAERLRAVYFTYLAQAPPFDSHDRRQRLAAEVTAIRSGKELA